MKDYVERKQHTLEDVKKIIEGLDKKTNMQFSKVEIKVSKRMTSTIAYASMSISRRKGVIEKIEPVNFTFSYYILQAMLTKEQFEAIVIHEYVHLLTNIKNKKDCCHNELFVNECLSLGLKKNQATPYCEIETYFAFSDSIKKYKKK